MQGQLLIGSSGGLYWFHCQVLNTIHTMKSLSESPFTCMVRHDVSALRQHTHFRLSSFFFFFFFFFLLNSTSNGRLIVKNTTGKLFLSVIVIEMALNYGRATLFSILSTMSISQPLSPVVWTNLVRAGITRVKPTRRGSQAERFKRRTIVTLVSNSRQPSVQMGYSGFLEQNVNKVTGNLHSEVSELNIHSDTSRRTTVVERSPLLPTQKDRSPMLHCNSLPC